jgi:hypothetical protein
MRTAILVIAALIGESLAGCGSEQPAAPPPVPVSASTPAPTPASATAGVPGKAPAVAEARPVGSGQDIRLPDLAARITVTEVLAAGDRYTVKVRVHVLRGTYGFGPAMVHLRHATGPDTGPIAAASVPRVAFTLHAGVTQEWEIPFGSAAGKGTQVQVVTPAGVVLAWTAR